MSDQQQGSAVVEVQQAQAPQRQGPPIVIASPPAAPKEQDPPGAWKARHAMWLATLVLVAFMALAGCGVLKFFELWTGYWFSIIAACSVILGVKPTADFAMAAVNRPKVVTQ